ncbi:MAG: DUF3156 family protein [Actinomycetota bacterium]|nr:DUF3156 family protein [Actinomycetota bacterium]
MLRTDVEAFGRLGYREARRLLPHGARLIADGRPALRLALRPTGGRIFGGTYALEVSTDDPVLPRTAGISARGMGGVKLRGISFRARSGDDDGLRLARRLTSDRSLVTALSQVHFEQIRVEPDGRAVIRHMGGSLVWLLFPPLSQVIPIVSEQVEATVAALEAFAGRGQGPAGDRPTG